MFEYVWHFSEYQMVNVDICFERKEYKFWNTEKQTNQTNLRTSNTFSFTLFQTSSSHTEISFSKVNLKIILHGTFVSFRLIMKGLKPTKTFFMPDGIYRMKAFKREGVTRSVLKNSCSDKLRKTLENIKDKIILASCRLTL